MIITLEEIVGSREAADRLVEDHKLKAGPDVPPQMLIVLGFIIRDLCKEVKTLKSEVEILKESITKREAVPEEKQ